MLKQTITAIAILNTLYMWGANEANPEIMTGTVVFNFVFFYVVYRILLSLSIIGEDKNGDNENDNK